PDFPAAFVLAVALGFVVSYNPLQSFLKEPDKVFLIVKEKEMHTYFKYSLVYNYVFQLYMVLIVAAAVAPMFMEVYPNKTTKDFFSFILMVLILKASKFVMNLYKLQVQNVTNRRFRKVVPKLICFIIFFFLLQHSMLVIGGIFFECLLGVNKYFFDSKTS